MTAAVQSTPTAIPFLGIRFELSSLDKKVLAVAIASLVFFGLQLGLSLSITLAVTLVVTTLTYLAEKYIRTEPHQQNDWFNTSFDKKGWAFLATLILLRPLIFQIILRALGIPLPAPAQEGLHRLLLSQPWKMIPLTAIVAPISEEILFRGFVLERLEDTAHLLNRHIFHTLPQQAQQRISNLAQALIFSAVHFRQAVKDGKKIPIFLLLSALGAFYGGVKQDTQSLIPPMLLHSANNTGALFYLFSSRPTN
jgi:membrane protease YdiL (CAAX protease family)